ncbi:EI24 domain-containing protein [Sulfurovum sp. XGS-02]|uniref:EI24 domain-containing protein n=1 Tax=Sulfurovum sp. XGS-02 TaxID=2925411 RepID=UPI00206832F3|nr:EI24 domain-containing protein [Sulfurovum sp. XGS-02]UPT77315.1 EI24 domain-containing protein [Sulfurovum sp. XGS-02]
MKQIIIKSLQDILSKDVILFVIKMGSISLALTLLFAWSMWGLVTDIIASYLSWIPWEWLQTSGASVGTFLLTYMLFIIMVSLLTSLYSEKLLLALAKKRYADVAVVGSANLTTSILLTLKASIVFLLLFILTLPLLFIPIVGQVWVLYLWSVLLKEPTMYDVGALFIKEKKTLKEKKKKTTLLAMIASLFNYIPLVNIFAPVFAQILFLHHILGKEHKI